MESRGRTVGSMSRGCFLTLVIPYRSECLLQLLGEGSSPTDQTLISFHSEMGYPCYGVQVNLSAGLRFPSTPWPVGEYCF